MMDDTDNFPYDNVEFPVRRPQPTAVGVGPAPRLHIQHSPHEKHQASSLAPVIEMEGSELDTDEKVSSFTKTSSTTSTNVSSRQGSSYNQSSLLSSSTPVSNQVLTTQTKTETQSSTGTGNFPPNKPMVVSIQQGKVVTKQPGSVMFPFERNDFNPRSQEVLNKTYTDHKSYSKLYNLIMKQGFELQKPLYDAQSKLRDKLTYEQLLQGMLFDGERLLLSGHWIYYTKVEFLDETGTTEVRPSLGSGRACLTNKRLMFLVAESNSDANLTPVGVDSRKPASAYKLSLSQRDDVVYQSIPLSTFRSVELGISVGATAGTKIVSQNVCLCNCLGKKWKAAPPVSQKFNKRTILMGISLPPWGKNSLVVMHVHPDLPLTLSRDFVCYVQTYATQLH